MNTIDKIKAKLEKYPQLTYTVENNCITIDPPTDSGFSIWLMIKNSGFTVGFDGWHEEFEDEGEALNTLAFGLSEHCRLKIIKRGNTDCSWAVESKNGDEWTADSTTGLIFVPFWRKKTVEYRQNKVLVDLDNSSHN